MQWYYESEGQAQGPIPEPQLRRLLADQVISSHTRVWKEGMEDWAPWNSIPDGEGGAEESSTQNSISESENDSFSARHENERLAPELVSPSWEHPRGALTLLQTAFEVLCQPGRAFRHLNHSGTWGPPLAFYLFGSVIGWLSFFETAFLLAQHDPNVPPQMLENFKQLPEKSLLTLMMPSLVLSATLGPVFLLAATSCLHGALFLSGAAKRPMATTYRVTAYLLGALGIGFSALPATIQIAVLAGRQEISGLWISNLLLFFGLWGFFCVVRGAASAHAAHPVRVLFGVTLLVLTTVVPPFLLLMKVAEIAAMKD